MERQQILRKVRILDTVSEYRGRLWTEPFFQRNVREVGGLVTKKGRTILEQELFETILVDRPTRIITAKQEEITVFKSVGIKR